MERGASARQPSVPMDTGFPARLDCVGRRKGSRLFRGRQRTREKNLRVLGLLSFFFVHSRDS